MFTSGYWKINAYYLLPAPAQCLCYQRKHLQCYPSLIFYCTAKFLKYIYKEQRKPETPAARVCELTVWIRWGLRLVWQLLGLLIHCTGQHSLWTCRQQTGKKKTQSTAWWLCVSVCVCVFLCQHFCVPPILTNCNQTGRGESLERHKSMFQTQENIFHSHFSILRFALEASIL